MKRMVKSPLLRSARMPMLELILVIGYFSVISVFILQLFLSANMLQSKAKDEGKAIMQSEKIAETIKAAENFEVAKKESKLVEYSTTDEKKQVEKEIINQLKGAKEQSIYTLHYDKDWNESTTDAMYTMVVIPSINSNYSLNMEDYEVYVYRLQGYTSLLQLGDKDEVSELYHLCFSKYRR